MPTRSAPDGVSTFTACLRGTFAPTSAMRSGGPKPAWPHPVVAMRRRGWTISVTASRPSASTSGEPGGIASAGSCHSPEAGRYGLARADRDRACLLYTSDAADDLLCVDLG